MHTDTFLVIFKERWLARSDLVRAGKLIDTKIVKRVKLLIKAAIIPACNIYKCIIL